MIDAGLPKARLLALMHEHGVSAESVSAILLTHEHGDHACGAVHLARALKISVIGTTDTIMYVMTGDGSVFMMIPADHLFSFGDFQITSIPVVHDAMEPSGFVFESDGFRLGWFTDLSVIDDRVRAALDSCDAAFLEANYDADALAVGPYELAVKRRISGPLGHLSNDQVCEYVRSRGERLKHLILGHLSESANGARLVETLVNRAAGAIPLKLSVIPSGQSLDVELRTIGVLAHG